MTKPAKFGQDVKRNKSAACIKVDARIHKVLYRASQVERSAPCYQTPALKLGMRVAILEQREEFSGVIPAPKFYEAQVVDIKDGVDPTVTLRYKSHPWNTSISCGMSHIAKFCVIIKPRAGKEKSQ